MNMLVTTEYRIDFIKPVLTIIPAELSASHREVRFTNEYHLATFWEDTYNDLLKNEGNIKSIYIERTYYNPHKIKSEQEPITDWRNYKGKDLQLFTEIKG